MDLTLETYPAETTRFLNKQKNPFANPVGDTFTTAMTAVLDEMLAGGRTEVLREHLDPMVKVRNVQDYTPSRAIGFVFLLKNAVREQCAGRDKVSDADLRQFEDRIDGLALVAFDLYMADRVKMQQILVNEAKRKTAFLLKRVNKMNQTKGDE